MEHKFNLDDSPLKDYLQQQDYESSRRYTDMLELQFIEHGSDIIHVENLDVFYAIHISLYVLAGDIYGAKYLWKRAPDHLKADANSEFNRIWRVCQYLHANNTSEACALLLSNDWSVGVSPVIKMCTENIRRDHMNQIACSYECISLSLLSRNLALSAADCIAVCNSLGWNVNAEQDLVVPVHTEKHSGFLPQDVLATQSHFALGQYSATLEKQSLRVDVKSAAASNFDVDDDSSTEESSMQM
eukprot:CAMPEP_0185030012 /NCGR_PEP_ID=MMETSP1103-20130426/16737_1 /TAXON_ID=36769 /ORGANISM="Paraphysomonas bandaiensis, Strain Caron Lab Isolate" /LENGTH=242 /DNA_ID=CAMNT_0027564975 /DNA_START=39 /DNA_END=767 /DNA_ORIENTATION=+